MCAPDAADAVLSASSIVDAGPAVLVDCPLGPAEACATAGHPLDLRIRPGHDHGYYFIASFIGEHIAHHAVALRD